MFIFFIVVWFEKNMRTEGFEFSKYHNEEGWKNSETSGVEAMSCARIVEVESAGANDLELRVEGKVHNTKLQKKTPMSAGDYWLMEEFTRKAEEMSSRKRSRICQLIIP